MEVRVPSFLSNPIYQEIQEYYQKYGKLINMNNLFEYEPERSERFSLRLETSSDGDILLDYSKNRINCDIWKLLLKLAESKQIFTERDKMFSGSCCNFTQNRPVLHTALRSSSAHPFILKRAFDNGIEEQETDIRVAVLKNLDYMKIFSNAVNKGEWKTSTGSHVTDVVNISSTTLGLGPQMVIEAMKHYKNKILCHFVTDIDATQLVEVLAQLNYANTLFVIVSRNFQEPHVLKNALIARDWLLGRTKDPLSVPDHFVAVSNNIELVKDFGIDPDYRFELWDWIDERFSLWSAAGLLIPIAIGYDNFTSLLQGAEFMDTHFKKSELGSNAPVILALIGIWYTNFFNTGTHAILPYKDNMKMFSSYIQQLEMQGNGKFVTKYNQNVPFNTAPIVWGGCGTDYHYSFNQIMNQSTRLIPCDIIGFATSDEIISKDLHHKILLSNFIGQSEALMSGKSSKDIVLELAHQVGLVELMTGQSPESVKYDLIEKIEKRNKENENGGIDNELLDKIRRIEEVEHFAIHKTLIGNRPSNSIVLEKLTPFTIGLLIAMYEHKIFVQGIMWDINSFDNFGMELTNNLAGILEEELKKPEKAKSFDSSTNGLLNFIKSHW